MVQALDSSPSHPDLPQALVLLSEMNTSARHVASLVDTMIQKVRSGELSTDQGLSFLEMKYNMLLGYLINITYVILRKCSGERIEGDPCIDRLVEIRTVLEKIRPIDRKLKYQIDKLVKTAVTGQVDGLSALKPKAGHFETAGSDDESASESDGGDRAKPTGKGGLYVPPKISAVYFPDGSVGEKNKRNQERSKKMALSASIMRDLQEEYLDTPVEVVQTSSAQQMLTKRQKQIEEYEEEYMTRLPVMKADKHRSRQLTTIGTLGNEVVDFGPGPSSASSKKRKRASKSKAKSFKKKRHH